MYKVIIADDENKTCQLIRMLGDWERFQIEIAAVCTDGEEAYQAILTHHPDIVITDIRMPIYDGLKLIEKAKSSGIDASFIIISGYRHFEYAQNALRFGIVDYLLKPIDQQQLNEVLEKTCMQLEQKKYSQHLNDQARLIVENEHRRKQLEFLWDALDGRFSRIAGTLDNEEIKEKYDMELTANGVFQAMLLNIDNQELLQKGSLFVEKAEELFYSAFRFCSYAITGTSKRGIWCGVYFDGKHQMKVNEAIKDYYYNVRIMEEIYGNFRPVMGVGTSETDKTKFAESFSCADFAEWRKMAYGNIKIHYYKATHQQEIFNPEETTAQMKMLSSAMELLQTETVHQWFQMVRTLFNESEEKLLAAYELRRNIIDTYQDYLNRFWQGENQNLEEKSYRCSSLPELWKCLEDHITGYLQEKLDEKARGDIKPILMVKQYVENHLSDVISLEDAAAMAGFAPAYFSNVFKKQTGQNFSEYLTETRMQEAKRLLRSSDKSIGEIAALTGYPDDKYFRKLFKKVIGIKASEYRKLYL